MKIAYWVGIVFYIVVQVLIGRNLSEAEEANDLFKALTWHRSAITVNVSFMALFVLYWVRDMIKAAEWRITMRMLNQVPDRELYEEYFKKHSGMFAD